MAPWNGEGALERAVSSQVEVSRGMFGRMDVLHWPLDSRVRTLHHPHHRVTMEGSVTLHNQKRMACYAPNLFRELQIWSFAKRLKTSGHTSPLG